MPTPPATKKARAFRAINPPLKGNKIFGDDVPMFWKDAAIEAGIAERTFRRLIDNKEIDYAIIGGRLKVRPSAVRKYADRQSVSAR